MRWLARLRMRIEMLFRRERAAGRLDEELRHHLERQIAENVAAGMNAEEARWCGAAHVRQSGAAAGAGPRCLELDVA